MKRLRRLLDWLEGRSGTVDGLRAMSVDDYAAERGEEAPDWEEVFPEFAAILNGENVESEEEEAHECGPECRQYTDEHIDALAHDIAQAVLGKTIDREEWEMVENFPNVQGFRRAARYVLGSTMGLDHETEGGHKPGEEDCPECRLIAGFAGEAEDGKIPAPSQAFPNGTNLKEMMKREHAPDHIELRSDLGKGDIPQEAAFSAKVTYGTDPANMEHVGWITERGLVLKDGIEMSDSQRAELERTALDHLGLQKRDGEDIDIRRLTDD